MSDDRILMRVLVGCESSARVRDAFRARGHDACSVDVLPTEGDPRWHIQGDVREVLTLRWDLGIFFPPCDHLSNTGARWWPAKQADGRQQAALEFVRTLMSAPIPRIAIENPVGRINTAIRKPDQIVQPWQFGDPYQKQTCLWLKNLPLLIPEIMVKPENIRYAVSGGKRAGGLVPAGSNDYEDSEGRVNRARVRSRTFPGIARAMSEQWS